MLTGAAHSFDQGRLAEQQQNLFCKDKYMLPEVAVHALESTKYHACLTSPGPEA